MGNYPGRIRRPSFPTVISLIALFVALGGTSYAVIKLPAKSVGNRELKSNAVTSAKIRAGSVSRSDLAPSARAGSRGPRGATGPAGPAGADGDAVAPEPWKPLPLASLWRNYGQSFSTSGYRKDARGRVYVRGLVAKDGDPLTDEVIATLPAGYRPPEWLVFPVATGASPAGQLYGRADVNPSGEIVWRAGATGAGEFVSLETLSFWAE